MSKIDLLEFVSNKVKCGKKGNEYPLYQKIDDLYIMLSYNLRTGQGAKREYSLTIPRYVGRSKETFEALGLLQAEMGKTDNGCIVFCNHEFRLINKVMKWFDKELEMDFSKWKWYIKVNINEPNEENYKKEVEDKVVNYWLNKTRIYPNKKYPKTVSYIKNTSNQKLKHYDYGTLIIEYKSNLLSQIIKRYVKIISFKIPNLGKDEIKWFMNGVIAGESNVEIHKPDKRYRVYISSTKKKELELYQKCLANLGIYSKQYQNDKIIISKRENNIKLLKQRLMCLSPEKYNKFLYMIKLYPNISQATGYFTENKKPWNKIPQEKINKILELHYQNPEWPCWKVAEEVGVSTITVARVRKEHNLGKRLNKTSKEMIKRIIDLRNRNPSAYAYEIANQLGLHKARVERVLRKYR